MPFEVAHLLHRLGTLEAGRYLHRAQRRSAGQGLQALQVGSKAMLQVALDYLSTP